MKILRSVDIEEQLRLALADYFTAYVRPLPPEYELPNVLISAAGGTTGNTIDTFTVTISARAETDAESYDYLRTVLGALEELAKKQVGALRHVSINSLASWGNDPVRPDLKLSTATVLVTAHRESFEISES